MNIMTIEEPIIYIDSKGDKFIPKTFWFEDDLQEIMYEYTNGKRLTESEQKKYLTPVDMPRSLPTMGTEVQGAINISQDEIRSIEELKKERGSTKIEINNSEVFNNNTNSAQVSNTNLKPNNLLVEKVNKILDKSEKSIEVNLEVKVKLLSKSNIEALMIIQENLNQETLESIIVDKSFEKLKSELEIVVKKEIKEIIDGE